MRWLSGICLLLWLAAGAVSAGGQRPVVAVFPIQDVSGGLDADLLDRLSEYLSAAVAAGGHFAIQAPGDMRRLLGEKQRESYSACYDEKCQIELGRELAANKMLSAKIIPLGTACTVTAALYDLRTQATDITATADGGCSPAALKRSLDRVAAKFRAWGVGRGRDAREGPIGEPEVGVRPGDYDRPQVIVAFRSRPPGAVVIVDGELVCESTPCSRKLAAGEHEVSMQKKRYRGRTEQVLAARGAEVDWALEPTFATVRVTSDPPGHTVRIDGREVGRTPLEAHPVEPGRHEVLVTSPCHFDKGERIQVAVQQQRTVAVTLVEKMGGLQVDARDTAGNDVPAELWLDGRRLGEAPGRFQVPVCAERLEARSAENGRAAVELDVEQGGWRKLVLTLQPAEEEGPAAGGAVEEQAAEKGVSLRLVPTFGYGLYKGLEAQAADEDRKVAAELSGPTAGLRVDLLISSLFGLCLQYDYHFLETAGIARLGAGIDYGGLWAGEPGDWLVLDTNMGIWGGLTLFHGAADSFAPRLAEDALAVGFYFDVELGLDLVFAQRFIVGAVGDLGYLYPFAGSTASTSATYLIGARLRLGLLW
jgi:hypothetical protein